MNFKKTISLGFIAILMLNFPMVNSVFADDVSVGIDYREEVLNMSIVPCMQYVYDEVKMNEIMPIDKFIQVLYMRIPKQIEFSVFVVNDMVKNKPLEERSEIYAITRKKCMEGIIAGRKKYGIY